MSLPRNRLIEIVRRKERLIARGEAQRAVIRESVGQLRRPIAVIDRGLEMARFLRAHPLLVAALVGTVAVLRPRGLLRLAGRGLTVWRLWRSLAAWMA